MQIYQIFSFLVRLSRCNFLCMLFLSQEIFSDTVTFMNYMPTMKQYILLYQIVSFHLKRSPLWISLILLSRFVSTTVLLCQSSPLLYYLLYTVGKLQNNLKGMLWTLGKSNTSLLYIYLSIVHTKYTHLYFWIPFKIAPAF